MAQAADTNSTTNVIFLPTANRAPVIPQRKESPLLVAHANMIAALTGFLPHHIIGDADVIDIENRGEHVRDVMKVVATYVEEIAGDTADRMPAGIIFTKQIKNQLSDTISDVAGAIHRGAITMEMSAD